MNTNISNKKLKNLIKESVKEVFESEIMKLWALALPEISKEEQKEIEKNYGKTPSSKDYNETISLK